MLFLYPVRSFNYKSFILFLKIIEFIYNLTFACRGTENNITNLKWNRETNFQISTQLWFYHFYSYITIVVPTSNINLFWAVNFNFFALYRLQRYLQYLHFKVFTKNLIYYLHKFTVTFSPFQHTSFNVIRICFRVVS